MVEIKLNQSALAKLAASASNVAEDAVNRGIVAAQGQPLERAVETVAAELRKANVEPNRSGIRAKLVEVGWE